MIYVVNGLWTELESGSLWRKIAASVLLISPFSFIPGAFPLVPSLFLSAAVFPALLTDRARGIRDLSVAGFYAGIVILLISYVVFRIENYAYIPSYILTGVSIGYSSLRQYIGDYAATVRSIPILLIFHLGILLILVLMSLDKLLSRRIFVTGFLVVFALTAIGWLHYFRSDKDYLALARSYKQVQMWAKEHTNGSDLFMVDPTIYYGWRDYSQRSSFGDLRSWLFNWANSNNAQTYQEGLKRFREFSIPLNPYLETPRIEKFANLSQAIQTRYYDAGDDWRMELSRRYGVHYFVLMKSKMKEGSDLTVSYENRHFAVLSID